MKQISNWSLAGIATGLIFAIGSFARYWVLYPDHDKALAYILIGGLICGWFWHYNKQLEMSNTLTAVEDYLADKKYN